MAVSALALWGAEPLAPGSTHERLAALLACLGLARWAAPLVRAVTIHDRRLAYGAPTQWRRRVAGPARTQPRFRVAGVAETTTWTSALLVELAAAFFASSSNAAGSRRARRASALPLFLRSFLAWPRAEHLARHVCREHVPTRRARTVFHVGSGGSGVGHEPRQLALRGAHFMWCYSASTSSRACAATDRVNAVSTMAYTETNCV